MSPSPSPAPRLNSFTPASSTSCPQWQRDGGCGQSATAPFCCSFPWSSVGSSMDRATGECLQPRPLLTTATAAAPPLPTPWHRHPMHSLPQNQDVILFSFSGIQWLIPFCVQKWCSTSSLLILNTPAWCVRNRRALARTVTSLSFTHCRLLPFLRFQWQFSLLWQLSTLLSALRNPFFSGIISEIPSVSSMFI